MLDIDISGVDAVVVNLRELADRTPKAIVGGLNYAITAAEEVMAPAVAGDIGMDLAAVRKQMAIRKATTNQLSATLSAASKRIPLMALGAQGPRPSRGKGQGVTYQLRGGSGRLPNAFITETKSGHVGVFVRIGTSARQSARGWSLNLPIAERFGPSIGHVFSKYRPLGVARAVEAFTASFPGQLTGPAGGV